MSKRVQKSIRIKPELWDWIEEVSKAACRKPSQEIEYIIQLIKEERFRNNNEAINLATTKLPS